MRRLPLALGLLAAGLAAPAASALPSTGIADLACLAPDSECGTGSVLCPLWVMLAWMAPFGGAPRWCVHAGAEDADGDGAPEAAGLEASARAGDAARGAAAAGASWTGATEGARPRAGAEASAGACLWPVVLRGPFLDMPLEALAAPSVWHLVVLDGAGGLAGGARAGPEGAQVAVELDGAAFVCLPLAASPGALAPELAVWRERCAVPAALPG